MKVRRPAVVCSLVAASFVLILVGGSEREARAATCSATTVDWDGGAGTTTWTDAANWSANVVPSPADHVCVPVGQTARVTTTVTVASVSVPGTLQVAGGTLTLTDATRESFVQSMTLGATLSGAATIRVDGALTWSSGAMSGSGSTVVEPGASLVVTSAAGCDTSCPSLQGSRRLVNNGTLTLNGSVKSHDGTIADNTGVVELADLVTWRRHGVTGQPVALLANKVGGVVRKSAGTSAATVDIAIDNDGTVAAAVGSLSLSGGDSGVAAHDGVFGAGATFVAGQTFGLPGATLDGARISGGLLGLTGTTSVTGNGTVLAAGTVSGAGTLRVDDTLSWPGGVMSGSGSTVVSPGGRLVVTSAVGCDSACPALQGTRRLVNNGTVALNGSVKSSDGTVVDNASAVEFAADFATWRRQAATAQPPALLANRPGAVVRKTAGTSVSTIEIVLDNDGTVDGASGSLSLAGGDAGVVAHEGVFGARAAFVSGPAWGLPGATLDGARLSGATLTLTGTTTVAGSGTVLEAGAVAGAGTLKIDGTLTWPGGAMSGSGTTVVSPGARLVVTSTPGCDTSCVALQGTRRLVNNGTVALPGSVRSYDGTLVDNAGVVEFTADFATWRRYGVTGQPPALLANRAGGVVRKTAGTSASAVEIVLDNDGVVDATAGTLSLAGGDAGVEAHAGTYGTGAAFVSGPAWALPGATLDGARISGATLALTGTTTVSGTGTSFAAGTVSGAGTLTIDGTLTWPGGVMSGSGSTVVSAGGRLVVTSAPGCDTSCVMLQGTRRLVNNGTVSLPGSIRGYDGTVVDNAGLVEFTADFATWRRYGATGQPAAVLVNRAGGVVRKTAGTSASTVELVLDNDGLVDATSGMLSLSGGDAGVDSHDGTYGAGAAFVSGPGWALPGATLDGARISGATLALTGTTTVAGTATALEAGAVSGSGTLLVDGRLTWTGGSMSGSGITRVSSSAELSVPQYSSTALGSGRTIHNLGTFVISESGTFPLAAADGALIRNDGSLTLVGSAGISDQSAAGTVRPLLVNNGTLTKTGEATSAIGPELDNQGDVVVAEGLLDLAVLPRNYASSRRTLTGGRFALTGSLRAPALDVATLSSTVELLSADAQLLRASGVSAFYVLTRISSTGDLTLSGGAVLYPTGALANAGTLRLGTNGRLAMGDRSFTQAAGALHLHTATSSVTATVPVTVSGGTVDGVGSLAAPVTHSGGTLSPGGASVGTLGVGGSYTSSGSATVVVDVATAGTADRLAVTGAANVGGALTMRTATGYAPAAGDALTLLTGATRTGAFSPVEGADVGGGLVYWLSSTPTTVIAEVKNAATVAQFATVAVNGGATFTNDADVTLSVGAAPGVNVTGMRVANGVAPAGAFTTYASSSPWTLAAGDGRRTVYVQLRDENGNQSVVVSDDIDVDTAPPTLTITVPTTPLSVAVVRFSERVHNATASNIGIRAAGTTQMLPATLTCRSDNGAIVACATGAYTRIDVAPTSPLLPAVTYEVSVNPAGTMQILDQAANPAPRTVRSFAV